MKTIDFKNAFTGKKVLVTGHTGFKGSWLSLWLRELGAEVSGLSLEPLYEPNLFTMLRLKEKIDSRIGDIRDLSVVRRHVEEIRPQIIFHLAAQPIVRLSYDDPVATFSTNVLGTVHLLEAVRFVDSVRVCMVITSDKCYENREEARAFKEEDPMGGRDPYSASKGCAELAVASYRHSYFSPVDGKECRVSLSSVRAGNVIGGGDWAPDRILPDCIRSLCEGRTIIVRNPNAIRPWQHILEPLSGYLGLAARQLDDAGATAEAWNFGPKAEKAVTVGEVADIAVKCWGEGSWSSPKASGQPHEAQTLNLDCGKARERLGWEPRLSAEESIFETIRWYREAYTHKDFDACAFTLEQIRSYSQRGIGA